MPVILQHEETMESQHKISTKFGGGTLHVTNRALIIEIKKKGIVFHRPHSMMAGIEAKGLRKIKVSWPEGSCLHDFEFKAWGACKIAESVKRLHPYAENYSQDGITRVIFTKKQKEIIRKEREDWGMKKLQSAEKILQKNQKDKHLARSASMWRQFLLDNHNAVCSRSTKIPKTAAPDFLCWNDSWLAERSWPDKSYFCTFNRYWLSGSFPKAPVRGAKIDEETGAYCIPAEHVRFFHGYPYVAGDAFEDPVYEQGFFVPTMTGAMLDDSIMSRCLRPRDRHEMKIGMKGTLAAMLGYVAEAGERTVDAIHCAFTPREAEYLYRRGLLPEEAAKPFGWKPPTKEEVEGLLKADALLAV